MANITRFDPIVDMNDIFRKFWMRPILKDFETEPQLKMMCLRRMEHI